MQRGKNLSSPNFSFLVFFRKENHKNTAFRLTFTAENCCVSVCYSLHIAINDVAGGRVYYHV